MPTSQDIQLWLHEGITATKANQLAEARARLLDVVEHDQTNEVAWFWLYQAFERPDDKWVCLENLLAINSTNEWARQELTHYSPAPVAPPPTASSPIRPPLIRAKPASPSAPYKRKNLPAPNDFATTDFWPDTSRQLAAGFWVGISAIFSISGIMGFGEWLLAGLRTPNFPISLSITQAIEFLIAFVFFLMGLLCLLVAVGLFQRAKFGFYGSSLLAFTLLLVGPTMSLLTAPPNYPSTACLGGMFGLILLLTLASIPEKSNL